MNNEQNQKICIEKIHENLTLRGMSDNTFINYKSCLHRFFNYYNENTNVKKLEENEIINFLNNEYTIPNKSKYTYNVAIASIRLLYLVCFNKSLNYILLPSSKLIKRLPTFLPKDKFIKIINEERILKSRLILGYCSSIHNNI